MSFNRTTKLKDINEIICWDEYSFYEILCNWLNLCYGKCCIRINFLVECIIDFVEECLQILELKFFEILCSLFF